MIGDIEALKTAIAMEKESLIKYLEFARTTRDISGKNMFIRLATDEFSHMELLEEQSERITQKNGWSDAKIDRSEVEKVIPRIRERDKLIKSTEGLDEVAALESALELEERGYKYYNERGEEAENENARKMYRRLAEMERSHYDFIMAEMDYIKNTGFWFGVREFSLEMY